MILTLGLGSKQERKGYGLKWYVCVTVAVHLRLVQVQVRGGPALRWECGCEFPPLTKKVSTTDTSWHRKKHIFLAQCFTEYIKHPPDQAHVQERLDNTKELSRFLQTFGLILLYLTIFFITGLLTDYFDFSFCGHILYVFLIFICLFREEKKLSGL